MHSPDLLDALFREAVTAIDAGDVTTLERLMAEHPRLLRDRLDTPGAWLRDKVGGALEGFFQKPYLLWFVAEDPVRNGTLPRNIAQVTRAIIQAAQREGVESLREQLDYALRLVSWSWIARECGVQIELIDALVDAGASPDGNPDDALVNRNFAAAEHLVQRGATLTLATALCLGRWDDVTRLAQTTSARDKQMGFVLAALNGKAEALRRMIDLGVDLNRPSSARQVQAASPPQSRVSGGARRRHFRNRVLTALRARPLPHARRCPRRRAGGIHPLALTTDAVTSWFGVLSSPQSRRARDRGDAHACAT